MFISGVVSVTFECFRKLVIMIMTGIIRDVFLV